MRPGRHAAGDGSFGRSAGGAAFRGAVLLALAVLLGTLLLQATDDDGDPFDQAAGGEETSQTTTTLGGEEEETTGTTVRSPAQVKVIPLNASGVSGVAAKAAAALERAGYQVIPASNATDRATSSFVYFTPGFELEARQLAIGLGLAADAAVALPTPPPAPDLQGAEVVVLIGPDLAARLNAAASPTTTARAATATTAG